MACMSDNDECSSRDSGDSSQLTNWSLDSGGMCHMTSQVSDFIPGFLEDTDKYTEVADGYHVTAKQKVQVEIKMCDDNRDILIATLKNVILAPDICNGLFSIITLMNLGHTCLFHKGCCTVYLGYKEKHAVTLPHSARRKHTFLEKKEMSKTKKLPSRKKIALELLHQRLGHISTRSLMDGDNANVWEDIELRINPDPFSHHVRFIQ